MLNLLSQNCFFDSSGTCPKVLFLRRLGLIPKSCFSSHWDQSQLQSVHDIGIVPKTLLFIKLESIPFTYCTWHWDCSQSPIFGPLGLIPMWDLDCAISRELFGVLQTTLFKWIKYIKMRPGSMEWMEQKVYKNNQ